MLSEEQQAEILALYYGQHLGFRTISRKLNIDRKVVRKIVQRRKVSIEAHIGQRISFLDPFKDQIRELLLLDPTMAAPCIFQRIRKQGYSGGVRALQYFVQKTRHRPKSREAFLKLEFEPGSCAQVDWGEFGNVFGDGRKIHAFVMVLCFSRKLYVEFTQSEKFEDFIRCHENAFKFFGGVPKECWYDNLTSAVTERMGRLIRFNARFHAYMGHHGIMPYACTPARGNEKGRVEDGVKYLKSSFWPGRTFKDFLDLQVQAKEWLLTIANPREHRSTRKIPDLVFENEEKKVLLVPNPYPYDTDEVFSRSVASDFHITYETNCYSVPWTLVGMQVTIRVNSNEIKIFYNEKFITKHDRSYLKYQTFTKSEHKAGLLERKPGASHHSWQIQAIKNMGSPMEKYIVHIGSSNRSLRYETTKILALATIYGEEKVKNAVTKLLQSGIIGSDNIELMLKSEVQNMDELKPAPLTFQTEKLNRIHSTVDLRTYDAYLFNENKKGDPNHEPK